MRKMDGLSGREENCAMVRVVGPVGPVGFQRQDARSKGERGRVDGARRVVSEPAMMGLNTVVLVQLPRLGTTQ